MSQHPGPPTLSIALRSVVTATVEGASRAGLLAVVRPAPVEEGPGDPTVVPFPAPRPPLDEGPDAA